MAASPRSVVRERLRSPGAAVKITREPAHCMEDVRAEECRGVFLAEMMNAPRRVTLAGITLLVSLAGMACVRGGGGGPQLRSLEWQPVPQDPGAGDSLAAVRAIRRVAGPSRMPIVEAFARVLVGGRRFLVVRAESTHGTGFYQTAFYVFSGDADSSRVVLTALADETATANRLVGAKGYHIRGCLLSAGSDAFAYQVESSDPHQRSADSVAIEVPGARAARATGIYRWSATDSAFSLVEREGLEQAPRCSA